MKRLSSTSTSQYRDNKYPKEYICPLVLVMTVFFFFLHVCYIMYLYFLFKNVFGAWCQPSQGTDYNDF